MAKVRTLGDPSCTCTCDGERVEPLPARKTPVFEPGERALGSAPRPRRRINKGKGPFCVFSKNNKKVRCFRDEATAGKVARGFGPGFHVKKND